MKTYYYSDGVNSLGPYTLDELRYRGITEETLVYLDESRGWVQAGSADELRPLFSQKVPPAPTFPTSAPNASNSSVFSTPPKNYLIESILVTLFCCLPFGIAGIVNAAKVESRHHSGDLEGAIQYANDAKKWTSIGFWAGVIIYFLYFLVFLAGTDSGY